MGNANTKTFNKISYENIQDYQNAPQNNNCILINTLPVELQNCLIFKTISSFEETETINSYLSSNININIIIYGKNANDESIYKKYLQLNELGFENVFVYPGGLFEWLLLQDIYGNENFKTSNNELDLLKFKPVKKHIQFVNSIRY